MSQIPSLSYFCFCAPLRTGSLILAVLGILFGIIGFVPYDNLLLFNVIQGIFYLNAYGALLFGAIKYNDKAVLVNLVLTPNIIFLGIVGVIYRGISLNTATGIVAGIVGGIVWGIVSAFVNGYFWVCNYSFYKELKKGNENPA